MKILKWKHIAILASMCLVLFFACNHDKGVGKENPNNPSNKEPSLGEFKELTVHGKSVASATLNVEVENKYTKVTTGNVIAKFMLGGVVKTFNDVVVVGGEVTLEEGKFVDVKLEIPAKANSYQKWEKTIHVKRLAKGIQPNPNKEPQAELASLKIYKKEVSITRLTLDVPQAKQTLTHDDVEATFDIGGTPAKIPVTFNIEGDPVSLSFGANVVKFVVPDSEGKYKGFSKEITITRSSSDPVLELTELKIHGRDVENINQLSKMQVSVEADKVESANVKAKFEIEGTAVESITIKVVDEPVTLVKDVPVKVTLLVEAVPGKYQQWKHVVRVTKYEGTPIPNLTLQSLKVAKKTVNQSDWTVTVPKKQETLTASDIEAKFKLGGVENTYPVTVEGDPVSLSETEPTKVKLTVPGTGAHGMWEEEIMVTRKDVMPRLVSARIKVSDTPLKHVDLKNVSGKWTCQVPSSYASIPEGAIKAYFEWDGMEKPKPRELNVSVSPSFPIALTEGQEKEITLSVAAQPDEGLEAFGTSIYVTRISGADISLKKIKLFGKPLNATEIKDLNNPPSITTMAQKAFISFYSEENATQEDADLVKKITTEPELEETNGIGGKTKVWKFTKAQNTLKVSVSGTLVCTLTVNRTPLEAESITLYDETTAEIAKDVSNDAIYSTTKSKIQMQMFGINGLKYKSVSVKVGTNVTNFTKVSGAADIKEIWSTALIDLPSEENDVVVTVSDGDATFNIVRSFKLNKTTDPTTGPVPNKVKVKNLFVGEGAMDKPGKNKFSATYVSGDEHRLTVKLPKLGYFNQKLALVVEGEAEAITAKVSDDSGATEGVADGNTVFTSNKTYIDVKGNHSKFTFSLKNGISVATYEVTCEFSLDATDTKTVTVVQPANGVIKAWFMKRGNRIDIDLSSGKFEAPDNTAVYFELIGSAGHKPKKLVVGDTELGPGSPTVSHQTGGIGYRLPKVTKDITVTGECE